MVARQHPQTLTGTYKSDSPKRTSGFIVNKARGITPLVLALCLVANSPNASAQDAEVVELSEPAARQGYFIGGGVSGISNLNNSDEIGDVGPLYGTYFNLRLGEMVTDWLGFGFHVGGGTGSDDRYDVGYGGGMLDVQIVPWDHLALRLGVGAGGLSTTDNKEDTDTLLGTGGAYYMAGASYDYFPAYDVYDSGGFSFTPSLQLIHLPGMEYESYIVTLGLEMTWWTGLDNNKLILPDDKAYTKE